ncbi:MAG TPA: class I SAM-dependent methyltransferase [Thermoanaerobaculia bacterium]|nr:class I SAM-dependent methyltransferase [Thermoanaerobaculia bacterium]
MLKTFFTKMYENASEMNRRNLITLARRAGGGHGVKRLLDLGCDDGMWSRRLAEAVGAEEIHGVEVVEEQARRAKANGVQVYTIDLNRPLTDLPSNAFDVVHANQVIEHVSSVDLFVSEVYRVLKPGGHAVISTENGSSWHNVFAAAMGWQIFSLTNVSSLKAGLGNPFAIQRGADPFTGTWTHKTIFNYRGLIEMFRAHGFRSVSIAGAGYFPLPAFLGRIDPRHSAFITAFAQK